MHWFEAMYVFLKFKEGPFFRSKDNWGWILRLRPRNFVIISESLAANLEKVRQTSVWQTVPKFWFICFFIVPQILTLVSNAKRKISKSYRREKVVSKKNKRTGLFIQEWRYILPLLSLYLSLIMAFLFLRKADKDMWYIKAVEGVGTL